jgi:hypothetical protein
MHNKNNQLAYVGMYLQSFNILYGGDHKYPSPFYRLHVQAKRERKKVATSISSLKALGCISM